MKTVRANIRRVLETHFARVECFNRNQQREFARFGGCLAHRERIFASPFLGFKPYKLNDHPVIVVVRAHLPAPTGSAAAITAATFFTRLARLRLGGVPSAISTTMMLVTNFLGPCRSKSIEVRSLSDSVTTPKPYWKCLMYWPSGSAFNGGSSFQAIRAVELWPGKCSENFWCEKKGRTGQSRLAPFD